MSFNKGKSTMELPFGTIAMDGELPSRESVMKLFDQMDFQQASQAYLWALPLVSFAQWKYVHEHEFGANNGDIVIYATYEDKLGVMTANVTTPYLISFIDLTKAGPMVVDIPEKLVTGVLSDSWQITLSTIGLSSQTKDAGGKFILLPPGSKKPENTDEFQTIISSTMNVILALRVFETDEKKSMEQIKQVKIYPFSQKNNPPVTNLVPVCGKKYSMAQPRGIRYWKLLHTIIQDEVVADRDRFFMAMLHNLGIEKGKPFEPSERQQKIMIQGAEAGEMFAMVNAFSKRFKNAKHWSNKRWTNLAVMENATQSVENYDELNERSSFFYEAILYSNSFVLKAPAMGQIFLGTFTDSKDAWLDGSKTYSVHLDPNPPAKVYWSITIYDIGTRTPISNEERKADIFSKRDDILLNEDGSISIYFGPKAPIKGKNNWLQTNPGKKWFVYLRLYYPLQPIFDKSWEIGDIEELK